MSVEASATDNLCMTKIFIDQPNNKKARTSSMMSLQPLITMENAQSTI